MKSYHVAICISVFSRYTLSREFSALVLLSTSTENAIVQCVILPDRREYFQLLFFLFLLHENSKKKIK